MMSKDNITYFEQEGNRNFDSVIAIVEEYLQSNHSVKNISVFAGKMNSVIKLHSALEKYNVNITVTTYPFGREFTKMNSNADEPEIIIPDVTTTDARKQILALGMNYVQGGLPFEPIRSCTGDHSTEMIISSFNMIAKGLIHCISSAIMVKENGYLADSEKIVAIAGDTAIVATPTIRRDIFNGKFKIHKILCKPL